MGEAMDSGVATVIASVVGGVVTIVAALIASRTPRPPGQKSIQVLEPSIVPLILGAVVMIPPAVTLMLQKSNYPSLFGLIIGGWCGFCLSLAYKRYLRALATIESTPTSPAPPPPQSN